MTVSVRPYKISAFVGRRRLSATPNISQSMRTDTQAARKGMQAVVANYIKLIDTIENVSAPIIYNALIPAFELSQEYCPKDTGKLVDSGYLEVTAFRGVPTVEIGYGKGGEPDYAVTVHENMEWRHEAPTRAKWLQVALAENAGIIQTRIIEQYKGVLK